MRLSSLMTSSPSPSAEKKEVAGDIARLRAQMLKRARLIKGGE
jgi:hypothetical protein